MNLSFRSARLPALTILASLAILAPLTAGARAAEIKLKCAGPGPRSVDSANTIRCAANPGKARRIAGTVRNDAGQPVAAKVAVTRSTWAPAPGGGYTVKPTATTQIAAKADGTFSFRSSPKGRESLRFDVVADQALGIAGASAQAEVARRLVVKVAKLGGGRIRLTIKGTRQRPLKVTITDAAGYSLPDVKPKNASRRGKVTFRMGATRSGRFSYFVDAGAYKDLFWYESGSRKTFKLRNGN